eukprot:SAG11_NODE_170_length_13624_cov_40.078226_16_plen_93_part_00
MHAYRASFEPYLSPVPLGLCFSPSHISLQVATSDAHSTIMQELSVTMDLLKMARANAREIDGTCVRNAKLPDRLTDICMSTGGRVKVAMPSE